MIQLNKNVCSIIVRRIFIMKRTIDDLLSTYPKPLLEMITGKLLGDGNLTIQTGRSSRFRFGHSLSDRDWCVHCYQELSQNINLTPPKYRKIIDSRLKTGFSENIYVQSKTNPIFNLLKDIWYSGRTKVLPAYLIQNVLSPLTIAWWYQDDGHLKRKEIPLQK